MSGTFSRLSLCTFFLAFLLLAAAANTLAGDTVYCRYNIHVQDQIDRSGNHRYKASYANYTDPGPGHLIIPAGSQIVIQDSGRKGFSFRYPKSDIEVDFEVHEQRMGMSTKEYIALITSPKPVSLDKFAKVDRKGIESGTAAVGMSKEGVLAALGYPAAHKTPSLESDSWTYWADRFRTLVVEFANGKVRQVRR